MACQELSRHNRWERWECGSRNWAEKLVVGRRWWEGATDWEAGFNPEGITGEPSGGIPVGVTWLDMHLFLCRRRENQGKAGSLIRRLMQWAGRERQRTEEVEKDSFLTLTYFFLCAIDPPPT